MNTDLQMDPRLSKPTVMVLEDQELTREGIVSRLKRDGIDVIGDTDDADTLMDMIEARQPNIVIVDLKLHGTFRGLQAIRDIKAEFPTVKCIVLTVHPTLLNLWDSIDAGAEAFLQKEPPRTSRPGLTLSDVVRLVAGGQLYYDGLKVKQIIPYVDRTQLPQQADDFIPTVRHLLSERELIVLKGVAAGLTNQQIADQWNKSVNTVKRQLNSINIKLGTSTRDEAVKYALDNKIL